jgi:hypothetical protein
MYGKGCDIWHSKDCINQKFAEGPITFHYSINWQHMLLHGKFM